MDAVTLQDVALRCNVHKSTVQRALAGSPRLSKKRAEEIRRVAHEMGYDYSLNLSARQLSARKTGRAVINHLVVMFLPERFLEDFYYSLLFRGIQMELRRENFDIITSVTDDDGESPLPLSIVRGDVDGVLMLCNQECGRKLVKKIGDEGNIPHCPMVSVMAPLEGCSSVIADERRGAFLALRHLIELGHQKILFLNGPNVPPYHLDERLEGYRLACEAAHLPFGEVVTTHILEPSPSLTDDLRDVVAHYFDGTYGFSAVMTRNDSHAVILRRVLAENGLRVPEDVSLIGFDDTRPLSLQYAEMNENFLSTVRLPLETIGVNAAQLLVQSIANKAERQTPLVAPVELVIRQTTAPPALPQKN